MSFSETIFLFFLALIIFGPKKLPEIARQAGKLLAELRRASNEFKSQIEQEIAHIEVENAQRILPPGPPPQGEVISRGANPVPAEIQAEPAAVSPSPAIQASSGGATPAGELPNSPASAAATPAEALASTSQESHV
ncbi:MAG TPA: twin-arginine translocase TatA/TatE family subunit [Candidatus Aquilonibacter sp.]|nr:twin-arginine translocase TatA/TatE family subunit [Candidatus Aquilonibacter sp.]